MGADENAVLLFFGRFRERGCCSFLGSNENEAPALLWAVTESDCCFSFVTNKNEAVAVLASLSANNAAFLLFMRTRLLFSQGANRYKVAAVH